MYIVTINTNPSYKKDMSQEEFRWKMVEELVEEVNRLKEQDQEVDTGTVVLTPLLQIREQGRDGSHHHDIQ